MAIVYKKPYPLERLKKAGYNQTVIKKKNIISASIVCRLNKHEPITFVTLSKLCELLHCQPYDLIEYVPDDEVSGYYDEYQEWR